MLDSFVVVVVIVIISRHLVEEQVSLDHIAAVVAVILRERGWGGRATERARGRATERTRVGARLSSNRRARGWWVAARVKH